MSRHLREFAPMALVACLLLAACGGDAPVTTGISENSTPPASVEGSYHASKLTLTQGGVNTDMLAAGAEISIVLTDMGATTGTIVIPAAFSESGTKETLSLLGTYTYDAETGALTFDQVADTFIRDAVWTAGGTQIRGVFDGGSYSLKATLKHDS